MITVLVFAYNLSDVTYRRASTYSELEIDLPGPIGDILDLASSAARTRLDDVLEPPEKACEEEIAVNCQGLDVGDGKGNVGVLTRGCLEGLDPSLVSSSCSTSLAFWSTERDDNNKMDDDEKAENDEKGGANDGDEDEGGSGDEILDLRSEVREDKERETMEGWSETMEGWGDATASAMSNISITRCGPRPAPHSSISTLNPPYLYPPSISTYP